MPLRQWAGALALAAGLAAAPSVALGQAEGPRLSDAWLSRLAEAPPVAWSHAFALRQETAAALGGKRRRLVAELESLITNARLGRGAGRAEGLDAWRRRLEEDESLPARTPGRFDLPWLGAHLRQDPPLSEVALLGSCEPPGWVEIWHLAGITRLPWREGLLLDEALDRLAEQAGARTRDGADHAWLITPTGERHRRGVAAWNERPTPLAAGSRVMLELPGPQGLTSALPLGSAKAADALVNARLPGYLATRLPGEACQLWETE